MICPRPQRKKTKKQRRDLGTDVLRPRPAKPSSGRADQVRRTHRTLPHRTPMAQPFGNAFRPFFSMPKITPFPSATADAKPVDTRPCAGGKAPIPCGQRTGLESVPRLAQTPRTPAKPRNIRRSVSNGTRSVLSTVAFFSDGQVACLALDAVCRWDQNPGPAASSSWPAQVTPLPDPRDSGVARPRRVLG